MPVCLSQFLRAVLPSPPEVDLLVLANVAFNSREPCTLFPLHQLHTSTPLPFQAQRILPGYFGICAELGLLLLVVF